MTPTPGQVAAFLAVIEHSTEEAAARALGIASTTLRRRLSDLYRRIGAEDRAHAAWLLYPVLGDRYVLPGDRKLRVAA